jgi:hypothetical protein
MWSGTPKRLHKPTKVFPFGFSKEEAVWDVMIAGSVEYWKDDGEHKEKDMAVRAKYVKDDDEGWLIKFLEVWLSP